MKPDIWAVDLPWPHLLEWNLFNSILCPAMAVDFDGILCNDCPPGSDDDGKRYADFLQSTRVKYAFRKASIPLIVTARLEKYRGETEEWLRRHGMSATKLVMGPWKNNRERARSDIAAFKAEHYSRWATRRKKSFPRPAMFVESDVHLAKGIAAISRRLVVCPAAGECYK